MKKHPAAAAFVLVMILRVLGGIVFSLTLVGDASQEGHMLIGADLPALGVAALAQVVLGRDVALEGAFDPTYLACSLLGWLIVALGVALVVKALVQRGVAQPVP